MPQKTYIDTVDLMTPHASDDRALCDAVHAIGTANEAAMYRYIVIGGTADQDPGHDDLDVLVLDIEEGEFMTMRIDYLADFSGVTSRFEISSIGLEALAVRFEALGLGDAFRQLQPRITVVVPSELSVDWPLLQTMREQLDKAAGEARSDKGSAALRRMARELRILMK